MTIRTPGRHPDSTKHDSTSHDSTKPDDERELRSVLGLIIIAVCVGAILASVFGGPLGFVVLFLGACGAMAWPALRYRWMNLRQRQALRLIAKSRKGISAPLLASRGYGPDTLMVLMGAGFVTSQRERTGDGAVHVVWITKTGKLALAWGGSRKD